ncbi:MAG: carboxy terminal-processing peptidase [Planctomycetaceae bacterium]|nr:carboxy terminal-processing peptidase [Planctomycetaceae bacterium]MCB9951243.1 carboxy terminal-processing peptidase [Planctomycetaceae bacterium]
MAQFKLFRARRLLAVGLGILGLSTFFAERLSSADPPDQDTARLLTKMISQHHLSRSPIDDAISSKLLDAYLKALDPAKLYFLQSDIDEFSKSRLILDDELKEGNVQFGYDVFQRYRERLDAQTEQAFKLIDEQNFDFTLDETLETDPEKTTWAKSANEMQDRWRRRLKFEFLQAKLDEKDLEETRTRLHKRYRNSQLLIDKYSTMEQLETYLTALTTCFDPHSQYMSPRTWEDFEIQLKLSLDGIGASLRSDDGYTIVASVVPGGAAGEDGRIQVNDKILAVGQEEGEMVDIYEMKLSDVVRMIRGTRGTKVRLQVRHAKSEESELITLTRQKIELKDSEVKGEIINGDDRVGRGGRVGVISIPSFYRDFAGANDGTEGFKSAAVDVARVLADFRNQGGVDVVVIDLRDNGGGSLTEAIEISGHFIDRGPVVQVKAPTGAVQPLDDEQPGVLYAGPLVVVCNRLSASASEIFAGVIQDYKRGLIIGDTTTHGKGTVQNLLDVSPRSPFRFVQSADRGKLKLTIQQFYRVSGDSTQNLGVRSDVVLPSLIDHFDLGESFLDNALPFDRISSAAFSPNSSINARIVADLQQNSEARVNKNEDFQKLERAIKRFLERKERTAVSLNEEKMRAERAEDEAAEKENGAEDEPKIPDPNAPIFPEGYYNNEIVNVALDYVAALKGNLTVQK